MKVVKKVHPPTGVRRLLFRLPIHLFRLRLGFLFGGRLMLLTHTGRNSGKPRQTVIEVVRREPAGSYVVASGFGASANWYRNVCRHPQVHIQVGNRSFPATGATLPTEEAAEVMADYAGRHPRAAKQLCRHLMGFEVDGSIEDFRAVGRRIPFLRFTPQR